MITPVGAGSGAARQATRAPWRTAAALSLAVVLVPGWTEAAAPAIRAGIRRPLLVTLVVDQLAAWVLDERMALLPPSGGLGRLVREGARVRDLRYAHAVTDTAPGHASLYTGATPRVHGIFANELPPGGECHRGKPAVPHHDRDSILFDPAARLVTDVASEQPACGVSLRRLRVVTLADALRARHPDAVIIALSLKERGAVFAGGRRPTSSLWYDGRRGRFVTSSVFAPALPPWIGPINAQLGQWLSSGLTWQLEDAPWVRLHAGTVDGAAGEGGDFGADATIGYGGLGVTFPHPVRNAKALRATPHGDELLLQAALAALDASQVKDHPTLLAVSLSSNDTIGHLYGPDSWEAWDELHRLDGALGRFFAELDRRFGTDGWAALLAGDHGTARMPEACAAGVPDRWGRPCKAGGLRLLQDRPPGAPTPRGAFDAIAALELAAQEVPGGKAGWIRAVIDPYLHLDEEALRPDHRKALLRAIRARAIPGLRSIYDIADLPDTCPPIADESEAALVCRSVERGGVGAFHVVLEPGHYFDPEYSRGHGGSHGTPHLYDRSVPLLARAPGRIRAGIIEEPLPFATFTRTAAALLGIAPPAAAVEAPDLTRAHGFIGPR